MNDDDTIPLDTIPLGVAMANMAHARRFTHAAKEKATPTLTLEIEAAAGLDAIRRHVASGTSRILSTLADAGHHLASVTIPACNAAVDVAADFGEDAPDARECLAIATDNLTQMRRLWLALNGSR